MNAVPKGEMREAQDENEGRGFLIPAAQFFQTDDAHEEEEARFGGDVMRVEVGIERVSQPEEGERECDPGKAVVRQEAAQESTRGGRRGRRPRDRGPAPQEEGGEGEIQGGEEEEAVKTSTTAKAGQI